jgi:CBS domain containing-hemolysin-like protein
MINELLVILILILISAFFSGTETAMFSLGSGRLSKSGDIKNNNLVKLRELLKAPDFLLSVILLGNLTVNTVFSHFAHSFLDSNFPLLESDFINLVIITIVLVISGEIVPKLAALRNAEKWSLKATPVIYFWMKITGLLSIPLNYITQIVANLIPEVRHKYNETELLDTLRFAYKDNIIHLNEFKALQRTIHFYHDTAYSIMIPRSTVTVISTSDKFIKIKKIFTEKKTNFAIVLNEKDNKISGYLSARAIIPFMVSKKVNLSNIIQPIIFIPETILLNEVLEELIKNRLEVAAIIDEMGEISGIITMKDIYQTLLGNFDDETFAESSVHKEYIFKIKNDYFRISGQTTLHDFNTYFNADIVSENSETISGFLIEKLDGFPQKNTIVKYKNLKFSKMNVKNNVIEYAMMQVENES